MKAFDPNYKLLDEMYQDDYYPTFLVDKVKDELQKVIDLLESGETDTEVIQETLDEAEKLAEKAKAAIKAVLADEDSRYHSVVTFSWSSTGTM